LIKVCNDEVMEGMAKVREIYEAEAKGLEALPE
jgi:hypothetical protein